MELHVWPALGSAGSLDAECLAAMWLFKLNQIPVRIVASGNVYVSPHRRLPALILESEESLAGFTAIASFVVQSQSEDARNTLDAALQAFVYQEIAALTQWTLFCHDPNWTGYTRTQISLSFPFPMQYNIAVQLQRDAAEAAKRRGITTKPDAKQQRGLSQLHSKLIEESSAHQNAMKIPKQVIQAISRAHSGYETVEIVGDAIDGRLQPAQLLLAAHLVLQTLPELPERPLESAISSYPVLERLRDHGREINVNAEPAAGSLAYTLPNYILSFTPWSVWA